MATRRVTIKGRWIVGAVLIGFVLTTAAVVARRSYGDAQARQTSGMEARLRQLRNERVRLEAEIRDGSSRGRLIPIAESKLGMHVPADTQVVILPSRQARRSGTP
jgi:cell division protein FtsL